MPPNTNQTRVAVLQAESCWFDLDASVQKAIKYIEEAHQKGAQLIAFPEVWIPGYPAWIWLVDMKTTIHLCSGDTGSQTKTCFPKYQGSPSRQ